MITAIATAHNQLGVDLSNDSSIYELKVFSLQMYLNTQTGSENEILMDYSNIQLKNMVRRYELDPFFRINVTISIPNLTIDSALGYLVEGSLLRNEYKREGDIVHITSSGSVATFHKVWKNCNQVGLVNIAADIDGIMGFNYPTLWSILKTN